jgi:hypothetical protein
MLPFQRSLSKTPITIPDEKTMDQVTEKRNFTDFRVSAAAGGLHRTIVEIFKQEYLGYKLNAKQFMRKKRQH